MKNIALITAVLLTTTAAQAESWTCSAPGLITGSYDGGDSAYIHLSGFPDGKPYSVKKTGNRASGTTSNGTKFTCIRK